jgi:putative membrane protein
VVLAVARNPWAWHAHPSVWAVIGLVGLGYAAALRVLGPRLTPAGTEVATRRQVATFYTGVGLMWLAADWPMHDIAERYLFSVHMLQHLIFTLVVPPLLLIGTPAWLMRWLLRPPVVAGFVRRVARPLPAAIIFNTAFLFTHWPVVVDAALHSESTHFLTHCLIFFTALLMWFPVMNRLPDYPTMSPPARLVYLFLQSVLPTVPASFLTFADGIIYPFYARAPHPFHISAVADQQLSGALMKVGGGGLLWGVIVVMFFRWYNDEQRKDAKQKADLLTWDDVARELERTPPPPSPSPSP